MTGADPGSGIAPLPVDQWSETAKSVLPKFLRRPELYLSGGPDAQPMPQALGLFAHHVQLGASWMAFNEVFIGEHATIDVRLRELAILRVAWVTRSRYEWKQHTRIGFHAGLTTEDLYAIPDGPASPTWTPLERAVLEAADQVVRSTRVEAGTWKVLAEHLDEAQLLELTFIIGAYLCFAAVVNSVGLEPDPPTEPVDAPEL